MVLSSEERFRRVSRAGRWQQPSPLADLRHRFADAVEKRDGSAVVVLDEDPELAEPSPWREVSRTGDAKPLA